MKGKSLLRKIGIWLALVGGTVYTISPKVKFAQHKYQQEIADVFWKTKWLDSMYKHENKETTTILNTLSWVIDPAEFKQMLLSYWYREDEIKIDSSLKPDIALYKTLWEMNVKYGNPRVTFAGNYKNWETWKQEDKRANFWADNTMHIHNIKNIKFEFTNPLRNFLQDNQIVYDDWLIKMWLDTSNQKLWSNRQSYLINNWIAELTHSQQYKRDGAMRMWIDLGIDYLRSWFDYDHTYDMNHTVENQAHDKMEPEFCKEFIQTYISHADMTDANTLLFVGILHWWYFEKYHDLDQSDKYLKMAAEKWSMQANFLLGRNAYKVRRDNQYPISYNWEDNVGHDCVLLRDLSEKLAKIYFNRAIDLGDKQYSQKYLSMIAEERYRYSEALMYTTSIVNYLETIHNASENELYERALVYFHLWILYSKASYAEVPMQQWINWLVEYYTKKGEEYRIKAWHLADSINRTLPYWPHAPWTDF